MCPEGSARGVAVSKLTSLGGQRFLTRRWLACPEGPARGAATFKARAHQLVGTRSLAVAVVGVFLRACEGGYNLQGPGTPAWGGRGCCLGGGRFVLKGLREGLPSSGAGHSCLGGQGVLPKWGSVRPEGPGRGAAWSPTPGHTILGGQGVLPRRLSLRPKGPARGAATFKAREHQPGGQAGLPRRWSARAEGAGRGAAVPKARAHQPMRTGSVAVAVVGASFRACEGGCKLQGPGTPACGDRGNCPAGGRCVLKGLRGGFQPSRHGHMSLG